MNLYLFLNLNIKYNDEETVGETDESFIKVVERIKNRPSTKFSYIADKMLLEGTTLEDLAEVGRQKGLKVRSTISGVKLFLNSFRKKKYGWVFSIEEKDGRSIYKLVGLNSNKNE